MPTIKAKKTHQPIEQTTGKRVVFALLRLFLLVVGGLLSAWLLYQSFPSQSRYYLAWLAVAPFVWGVSKTRTFWGGFVYGWFTGFCFHALCLYWIYYTCVHGGGLSSALSCGAWLGLSALLSLQFAFWGGCCHFLTKLKGLFPLVAAGGWVALEWLHQTVAFYGLGFPWLMLGYTQWNCPELIQLAAYTGTYGISFLIVFTGASIGWAFAEPGLKRGLGQILLAACVFLATYSFGKYVMPDSSHMRARQTLLSLNAVLMQPNIDQYKKWTREFEQEIQNTLRSMSASPETQNARLVVWPESALPGALTEEPYTQLVQEMAQNSQAYHLIGSNILEDNEQYVGAYLTQGNENDLSYRKVKLVPFGEYIPFEKTIRSLFKDVEVLGELGSFKPGTINQPLLNMDGVKIGTTVCYESIFPQLYNYQARQGAQLFVNITNDAWFFNTAAPYQHLAANVLRAVETGRPVLRAANTGFSAFINPFGQLEQVSSLFTQEILPVTVPLALQIKPNVYTQWGDWFAWVCAALFFTLLISTIVFLYE